MADKKISQLTGAATPLAGTEVLPIVQSGSTVKVSAADVTAGRAVSAASVAVTGSTPPANGVYLPAANTLGFSSNGSRVGSFDDSGNLLINRTSVIGTGSKLNVQMSTTSASGYTAPGNAVALFDSGTSTNSVIAMVGGGDLGIFRANSSGAYDVGIGFGDNANRIVKFQTAGVDRGRWDASGNLKIENGNLVVGTAAKGIDFSANTHAAGMTSELLNWYEEGTWTPAYDTTGNNFTTMTMDVISATYTRVGRQVTVRAFIRTDNVDATGATGNLRISGLPFTSAANGYSAISIGFATEWAGNTPLCGYVNDNSTNINLLYRSSVTGATAACVPADMTTGANADKNTLIFSATYFV